MGSGRQSCTCSPVEVAVLPSKYLLKPKVAGYGQQQGSSAWKILGIDLKFCLCNPQKLCYCSVHLL